jgi:hypothetical protein
MFIVKKCSEDEDYVTYAIKIPHAKWLRLYNPNKAGLVGDWTNILHGKIIDTIFQNNFI